MKRHKGTGAQRGDGLAPGGEWRVKSGEKGEKGVLEGWRKGGEAPLAPMRNGREAQRHKGGMRPRARGRRGRQLGEEEALRVQVEGVLMELIKAESMRSISDVSFSNSVN